MITNDRGAFFSQQFYATEDSIDERPPDYADFWFEKLPLLNASGLKITESNAIQTSAVMSCVKILSESVAMLPLEYFEVIEDNSNDPQGQDATNLDGVGDDDDTVRVARQDHINDLVTFAPNRWQTAYEWKEMMMAHLALRGNAYNLIMPGPEGAVTELIPKHPDRVTPFWTLTGEKAYKYTNEKGIMSVLRYDQVLHIPGLSFDGLSGLDPIDYAAQLIGINLSSDQYSASFLRNHAQPGFVLEHPGNLGPSGITNLRRSMREHHSSPLNAGNPLILEEGMKAHELGMKHSDAQFLEYLQFGLRQIARIFRIPLHMLSDVDPSQYKNNEQQTLDFVVFTLCAWLVRIESALNKALVADPRKNFFRFNVNALTRGDRKTRTEAQVLLLQNGLRSVNELRKEDGLNGIGPQGDQYITYRRSSPINEPNRKDSTLQDANARTRIDLDTVYSGGAGDTDIGLAINRTR
jgi:HK97 family phage portal protein